MADTAAQNVFRVVGGKYIHNNEEVYQLPQFLPTPTVESEKKFKEWYFSKSFFNRLLLINL